jgi:hypothetical protein
MSTARCRADRSWSAAMKASRTPALSAMIAAGLPAGMHQPGSVPAAGSR